PPRRRPRRPRPRGAGEQVTPASADACEGQPKRAPVHPTFGYNRAPHVKPSPNLEPDMDSQTVERRAQHQPRLEDDPLVRGLGRYAADAPMSGETQAYFVRSPHAFA